MVAFKTRPCDLMRIRAMNWLGLRRQCPTLLPNDARRTWRLKCKVTNAAFRGPLSLRLVLENVHAQSLQQLADGRPHAFAYDARKAMQTGGSVKTLLKALMCVVILSGAAKADSVLDWDFSFYSIDTTTFQPNGVVSGSGSFLTSGLSPDGSNYYQELSLTGTMNGDAMTFAGPCFLCGVSGAGVNTITGEIDPYLAFLNNGLYFQVDGVTYSIFDEDVGPFGGDTLFGTGLPLNSYGGYGQLLRLTLTDPPVTTPEASTFALLFAGLIGVAMFGLRRKALAA